MDPLIGELRLFGFGFAPRGWAFCEGQLLPISSNTALFSLLGTTYGGDGKTNFALPDLRGRVAVSMGSGPGLSPTQLGDKGGVEQVTLSPNQGPSHSHGVQAAETASTTRPNDAVPASVAATSASGFAAAPDGTAMNAAMIAPSGGGEPHENRQPYLVLNWCIALDGIFPSRS